MTKEFSTPDNFLFQTPLYMVCNVKESEANAAGSVLAGELVADGWCPYCHYYSTFLGIKEGFNPSWRLLKDGIYALRIQCAREPDHKLFFYIQKNRDTLTKFGQWPSFANIANDESKEYRDVLTSENSSELHKAIGLAAHGVGVGSFVYLRRIFERLIDGRYQQHKVAEGWTDEDFYRQRMDQKITTLAHYLPPFLVEHKSVYGVLSKGIHELREGECLAYFDILKDAIILILEEDMEAKSKAERKTKLAADLAKVTAITKDESKSE